ncbi:hypothetical protein FA13DRAFT_1765274 [Coprinellus micaceus]|uniref:Uncharacterized protein n=1 Tax=Coprinellus micaceus TaxID=71717 RepID=A0A4Y7T1D7_COPMI|nr:hypothetical protein FA13DRAFT_1765274 [Coprinellus micaceus]
MKFYTLGPITFAALSTISVVVATPTPASNGVMTDAQLDHWLATTDAELTFVDGADKIPSTLKDQAILATRVVYCSQRFGRTCGGKCTVYNGNAACLPAADTACLQATTNLAFCSRPDCANPCTELSACIEWLNDGFCYTPETRSIIVPWT